MRVLDPARQIHDEKDQNDGSENAAADVHEFLLWMDAPLDCSAGPQSVRHNTNARVPDRVPPRPDQGPVGPGLRSRADLPALAIFKFVDELRR
jgi:hypothetical protein